MGSRDWVDRRSVVKDPVNRREDAKWHGSSGESQSILNDDEVYDEEGCSKMRHRERERVSCCPAHPVDGDSKASRRKRSL